MNQVNLSDAEWKIMNLLWQQAPLTIMQITHELEMETGWSKHTVITMLNRMEQKGAVSFEEGQRAKQYFPVADRTAVTVKETKG